MSGRALDFIELLVRCEALRFGDFTLKSGAKSPFFVDLGQVKSGTALLAMGRALLGELDEAFGGATLLFGPAYKGIAIATALATAAAVDGRDLKVLYDRKEAKAHGEGGRFIGARPSQAERVVIVDDVISTGGTKVEAAAALAEAFGVEAMGILVGLDRRVAGAGQALGRLKVASVLGLDDLAAYLTAQGSPYAQALADFRALGAGRSTP